MKVQLWFELNAYASAQKTLMMAMNADVPVGTVNPTVPTGYIR